MGGEDVTAVPARRRPTGMVFQNYALFPNMTVGENVGYGLRVRKVPRKAEREQVADALRRVDLAGMEARPVTQLSGGQQQRVALARAVAVGPSVLLFDEPLSNLDVSLREQTRREMKAIQARLGTTSIYVTHDQQEALALSDRLAVMLAGRIVEVGTPQRLFFSPETSFVARFLGWNVLEPDDANGQVPRDAETVAAFRPESVSLAPVPEGRHLGEGRVESIQFLGTYAEWSIRIGDSLVRAWLDPKEEGRERADLWAVDMHSVRRMEGRATPESTLV